MDRDTGEGMEYRRLEGNSRLEVAVVGLGTVMFGQRCDADASIAIVNAALDLGVNFINTADIYGRGPSGEMLGLSEQYIGRAIRTRRGDAIVATKGSAKFGDGRYWADASRRHLPQAAEASLRP